MAGSPIEWFADTQEHVGDHSKNAGNQDSDEEQGRLGDSMSRLLVVRPVDAQSYRYDRGSNVETPNSDPAQGRLLDHMNFPIANLVGLERFGNCTDGGQQCPVEHMRKLLSADPAGL